MSRGHKLSEYIKLDEKKERRKRRTKAWKSNLGMGRRKDEAATKPSAN